MYQALLIWSCEHEEVHMLYVRSFHFSFLIGLLGSFCLLMLTHLFDRELNNMGIWYRMGNVPRAQDSTHTPTTNNIQNVNSSSSSAPVPAAPMPKYVHANYVCAYIAHMQKWFIFTYASSSHVSCIYTHGQAHSWIKERGCSLSLNIPSSRGREMSVFRLQVGNRKSWHFELADKKVF